MDTLPATGGSSELHKSFDEALELGADLLVTELALVVERAVRARNEKATFTPQLGAQGVQDREPGVLTKTF
jgi:hypothetical protein